MIVTVDWISFTFPFVLQKDEDGVIDSGISFERALETGWGDMLSFIEAFEDWMPGGGRAPYTNSVRSAQAGVTFWSSPTMEHVLCEISGTGCHMLRASGILERLIERQSKRITRIDIAVDIESEVKPREFATRHSVKRFKSGRDIWSETGETMYVGSEKSERYARVYRYFPPHPRSHLLRVEHVFRAEQAREVAKLVLTSSPYDLAASVGAVYGWEHPIWQHGIDNPTPVSSYSQDRHMGGTVRWLFNQVLPAIERVASEGEDEHVLMFAKEVVAILKNKGYSLLINRD